MAGKTQAAPFGGWRHRASQFYFLILLFSFPLFSIPCQKGSCASPVEVVAASLLSNGAPEGIVKAFLYPGLVFSKIEEIVADSEPFGFPDWNTILKDANMSVKGSRKEESSFPEVGIAIGSYLCVIGAFLAMFGSMLVSACGMVTILWYIFTLGGKQSDVFALPMFGIAMFCAIGGLLNVEGLLKRGQEAGKHSNSTTAGKAKKKN